MALLLITRLVNRHSNTSVMSEWMYGLSALQTLLFFLFSIKKLVPKPSEARSYVKSQAGDM